MNETIALRLSAARVFALVGVVAGTGLSALAAEFNITKTNLVEKWVTNVIEVRLPVNRFVNEYHTNLVRRVVTNSYEVFATNLVTRTVTNRQVIELTRTNYVDRWQTNYRTLNLTNWETVLVFKTNWINQPITNVVEIDMPTASAPGAETAIQTGALSMQARKLGRVLTNNQIEVQLTVKWTNGASVPLQVQQWRIEREDGRILVFGQDQEFRRALPPGKYKVQVKAQRDDSSPLIAAAGNLAVGPDEVLLQQRNARRATN